MYYYVLIAVISIFFNAAKNQVVTKLWIKTAVINCENKSHVLFTTANVMNLFA